MSNLLILGYYGFKDGYFAYGQYFRNYFNTVSFFPLIECRDLINYNKTTFEDLEKVIIGQDLDNVYSNNLNIFPNFKNYVIIAHSCDMIKNLKLGEKMLLEYILELKEKYKFKLIQIDWDPVLSDNHYITKDFDICFCADPINLRYKNVHYFPQGFSPNFSYYLEDQNYKCDISIICTNLYVGNEFPNQSLNRKIILDTLYKSKLFNLKIYGPSFLGNLYPDSYQRFIEYDQCLRVFSNSLISLNISPLNQIKNENECFSRGKEFYYSERLPQIFACHSIMLSNNDFNPLLIPDEDYIYIENINDLIPKIQDILGNKDKYSRIQNNVIKKKVLFNYENLIENISNIIQNS